MELLPRPTLRLLAALLLSATSLLPRLAVAQLLPGTLAAGSSHSLALAADGSLRAWGSNWAGQLGTNGGPAGQAGSATTYAQVAAGDYHTLAVRADGTLWVWGTNSNGQLGLGTTTNRSTPVQIGTGTSWVAVAGGYGHSLGLQADGTVWAWGSNAYGQLGDGTTANSPVPVAVSSPGTVTCTHIGAGGYHSLVRRANGTIWSWGLNREGQLGDNTTTDRLLPVQEYTGTTTWLAVASGYRHALASLPDGYRFASTGFNGAGQLGDGTLTTSLVYSRPGRAGGLALPTTAAAPGGAPSLYPNPAAGAARLHGAPPGTVVQVLDVTGRLVLTTTTDASGTASLALPAGLYLVRAGSQVLRLAVQ